MIRYPAKCILSGEHTVLRGGNALVCPLYAYSTTLEYHHNTEKLEIFFNNQPFIKEILVFLQHFGYLPNTFSGTLHITSNIPSASGLGSSAALCVAIAHLLAQQEYISADEIFDIARACEDLFHGKSSGVDIAGVMSNRPLLFSMEKGAIPFTPTWQPHLYISFSGEPSNTKNAVAKVKHYCDKHQTSSLDQQMNNATYRIYQALISHDEQTRIHQLAQGLLEARECFEAWGLMSESLNSNALTLYEEGALAVKPTGSGGGGYMLSLWKVPPPPTLNLIRVTL